MSNAPLFLRASDWSLIFCTMTDKYILSRYRSLHLLLFLALTLSELSMVAGMLICVRQHVSHVSILNESLIHFSPQKLLLLCRILDQRW